MLRFLLWRLIGLLATLAGVALIAWFLDGGPGKLLRGDAHVAAPDPIVLAPVLGRALVGAWSWRPAGGFSPAPLMLALVAGLACAVVAARARARTRRRYVRLRVDVYRDDHAEIDAIVAMYGALHKRLLRRWWRRLAQGQPSLSLEVHHTGGAVHSTWLALTCPAGCERIVEASLQAAYPNCRLSALECQVGVAPSIVRLKKRHEFIKRVKSIDGLARRFEPPIDRLLTAMAACGEPAFVQIALTPTPALFEAFAKHLFKRHEAQLSRERREHLFMRDRSLVEDAELRGGLDVQHKPLFFADLRVIAARRETCETIASQLRAEGAENVLVERGTAVRHGLLGMYGRRVQRGEGNPLPSFRKGVFASSELAAIWHLPSVDYLTVPFARAGLPLAPAPPAVLRPADGVGTLRDALGPVSIHEQMRRQNVAVPGTVEQGKSSFLVATVAEDLRRERCAVIVLDPKGDAAEAAVGLVPERRTCTLLDLSHPTCGFNPLAVDAPADVIADYVVAALKSLFTDADIRASSDRYLRNAIIAVLAYDRDSTLWDAARLLSVGEDGYAYRGSVGSRVRALPEFKEISEFFTAELSAQLADARSTTTAKLDAPVNKLARLLNSPSIKRVLLNDSLRVDFDRVIAGHEVLVVKGALGAMGAGNTSVLMQLLVGMLDAALARQQDLVPAEQRVAVALKVDEAPLVINRGFAETMALKRSAGLETVACWQTDSQWTEREVREQLDALFAHRVYFATASVRDARDAVSLTMAAFSDTVRPDVQRLSSLGRPDVRLHLPKHHAIASWVTSQGRQSPFIAQTLPLTVDRDRLAFHATRQHARGGRHLTDLRQPHWDRRPAAGDERDARSAPERNTAPAMPAASEAALPGAPSDPAESYRELVELDGAISVRWARRVELERAHELERLDLEMLELIATMRHVLTSQLHRRFNPERATTTTQRRLKRLSDAGLVQRFQFHRRDGGGVPMCYVIAAAGLRVLAEHDRLPAPVGRASAGLPATREANGTSAGGTRVDANEGRLRQARHDVHVAGWALALLAACDAGTVTLRGSEQSVLSPPTRASSDGRLALAPGDLRLPGGRTPHEFLRSDAAGRRLEVERFETVRPDAVVELRAASRNAPKLDVIVELDDRLPVGRAARKLERYDHFLAGWSLHTNRYGKRAEAVPLVVFVCRDRARARECAKRADVVLRACRAYAGEYPLDWEYPSRDGTIFVAERDVHEGLLCGYGVPRLPPEVRVGAAHGDPRAAAASVEARQITQAARATA
ncbi:MAG TPA: replication-relaxation family protein [Solirubrobacteraceae bacterium]|nr:replication-relaxation family protein [Solirubrobacteraceae bacterium]